MSTHPDPNRKAPRPGRDARPEADIPDMDHPPPVKSSDQPAFDRGTAAADKAARTGGITDEGNPTPPDVGRGEPGKKGGRHPPGDEN